MNENQFAEKQNEEVKNLKKILKSIIINYKKQKTTKLHKKAK